MNLQNISINQINIPLILKQSSVVEQFFRKNAKNPHEFLKVTIDLLLQAISNRQSNPQNLLNKQLDKKIKQTNKHYNVAYIKHNRFLSPTQKKQITPKITQIIPVSPQKIVIYGKPKVKLDDKYGCCQHLQNCDQYQQNSAFTQQNIKKCDNQQKQNRQYLSSNKQMQENDFSVKEQRIPLQYEEYLSPKNKLKKKGGKNKKLKQINQTIDVMQGNNYKVNMKQYLSPSSRIQNQNYNKVESKIKDLIQRDKRNREMQRQLQNQKSKIGEIEQRQNRLLMMQKYQNQIIENNLNEQNDSYNQSYMITKTRKNGGVSKKGLRRKISTQSDSEQSIVNLHGHEDQISRIKCYDCEIQRLRKRKQKAKLAVRQISRQQNKRSQLLQQIINSEIQYNQD